MESFKYYNKHPEERLDIPSALKGYLQTLRFIEILVPFVVILMLFLNSSGNTLTNIISTIIMGIIIGLMIEIYYRSMAGKFMLHEYLEITGKIVEIKETKLKQNGTKTQILVETPDKSYYNVYLKGALFTASSLRQKGMEVRFFMPDNPRESQGVYIVDDYYSIEACS